MDTAVGTSTKVYGRFALNMQKKRANAIENSLKEDRFVLSSISLHEKHLLMHDNMEAKNNQSLF